MKNNIRRNQEYLSHQLILNGLKEHNEEFEFIELYVNDEFYKMYDLVNPNVSGELFFESYMGSEIVEYKIENMNFTALLSDNNLLEFKVTDIFYTEKERTLNNVIDLINCEFNNDTKIELKLFEDDWALIEGNLNKSKLIDSKILSRSDENIELKIQEFINQGYTVGNFDIIEMPVKIESDSINILSFYNHNPCIYSLVVLNNGGIYEK